MAICRDCGQEADKWGNKTNQICFSCYQRVFSMKKAGKPYIRLLDLPEEERNELLKKREQHKGKRSKKQKEVKHYSKEVVNNKNPEKEKVLEEVVQIFKEHDITYPLENNSIIPIFKILKNLLNNYISPYLIGEDLMNKLELDYKHAKEFYSSKYSNATTPDERDKYYKLKTIWEDRHNALLELRRDIKNVISEYSKGGIIFTELSKDEDFMEKFNAYYDNLMGLEDLMESDKFYRAELSKLVADDEFCLGLKTEVSSNGKSKYEVNIKTHYGRSISNFTRMVWATSEEEAKKEAYKFIDDNKDKFKFTYNDNETMVNKLSINEPETPVIRSARR